MPLLLSSAVFRNPTELQKVMEPGTQLVRIVQEPVQDTPAQTVDLLDITPFVRKEPDNL